MPHASLTSPAGPTPRDTRRHLNQMERWLRRHATRFTEAGHGPTVLHLRALLELAHLASHAEHIAAELRDLDRAAPPAP